MADIELVIKIPEEIYKLCQEKELLSPHPYKVIIWDAVANGTPLPKGHGRLIDADDLKRIGRYAHTNTDIDNVPTIIEADKLD